MPAQKPLHLRRERRPPKYRLRHRLARSIGSKCFAVSKQLVPNSNVAPRDLMTAVCRESFDCHRLPKIVEGRTYLKMTAANRCWLCEAAARPATTYEVIRNIAENVYTRVLSTRNQAKQAGNKPRRYHSGRARLAPSRATTRSGLSIPKRGPKRD